ncbi:MAG: enoyl-CoA hydratase/isomerase family protein [Hydrogenibacillus schlegelii]|uniref:Enoyl-CoA hydratase/isomerase family protein n=1 Tax=Hydrogenibacillus schlegelii TaxID=1484 RepID=A0A947CWT7_HYDSH|nr:enoyl-CoA hydratase/isomerase family protein [Hydrogenibacillus schlegelii]
MTEPPVLVERKEAIATLVLNRPDVLNALDYHTLVYFSRLIRDLSQDARNTRLIIIKGAGRAFCVGADLKERQTLGEEEVRRNVRAIRDLFTAIERLPQPTIAMMHGYALGGGFELALACDFRFAQKETQMGLTEVRLGIIPGAGGTQRLPRLIGLHKAKEWILTGRRFTAVEAWEAGLLTGIAERMEDVERQALDLAHELLSNAPLALYAAKWSIHQGLGKALDDALDIEWQAYERLIPTHDRKEALLAFKEKRPPRFLGM